MMVLASRVSGIAEGSITSRCAAHSAASASAKAYVGEASRRVCGSSIQVHGGIGFTWEYDLHLYVNRAKHFEPLYGDADFHREQALKLMLERFAAQASQPEAVPALAS